MFILDDMVIILGIILIMVLIAEKILYMVESFKNWKKRENRIKGYLTKIESELEKVNEMEEVNEING